MTRKRILLHPLLLLALLLVLPADSVSRPVSEGPSSTHRLYHLLDPMDPGHVRRAAALRTAGRQSGGIPWIGIQRSASDLEAVLAPDLDLKGLDELLRSGAMHPSLLAGLRREARAPDGSDRVLLWDTASHTVRSGAATDAAQIVATAGAGRRLRTDVGVTTWGKVKELFR